MMSSMGRDEVNVKMKVKEFRFVKHRNTWKNIYEEAISFTLFIKVFSKLRIAEKSRRGSLNFSQ